MRLWLLALLVLGRAPASGSPEPSQAIPYFDGTYHVIEAENFTVAGGWSPRLWSRSENYFASVCFNTFMSRRGYLHADGAYNRVYGRLTNYKMWAFAGSRRAGAPTRGGLNGTVCGAEGPYALAQACMVSPQAIRRCVCVYG